MPVEGSDQRFRRITLERVIAVEIFPGEVISGSAGRDQFPDDLPPRGSHVVGASPCLDPRDDAVDLGEIADVQIMLFVGVPGLRDDGGRVGGSDRDAALCLAAAGHQPSAEEFAGRAQRVDDRRRLTTSSRTAANAG